MGMKIITCPNCGKLLESKEESRQSGGSLRCPRCGNVPILEDSQMIRISGGEIGGPGVPNLQEQQELVIHGGMAVESSEAEEKTFKVPEGTVEEEIDFEWKAREKKGTVSKAVPISKTHRKSATLPAARDPRTRNAPKTIRRQEPENVEKKARRATKQPEPKARSYPLYYVYLFYGVPGALLIVLVVFTLWRVLYAENLDKKWAEANETHEKGEVYYKKAQALQKKNPQQYSQNLKKAISLYREAIGKGEKVLEAQIQHFLKKGMTRAEAEQSAHKDYGAHYDVIAKWRSKADRLEKALSGSQ